MKIKIGTFKSFAEMLTVLHDDKSCRQYLEDKIWNGTPTCFHCGTVDTKAMRLTVNGKFKGLYKCRSCRKRFTVTLGTMFERSHIPLRKWFIAIYIFTMHKKGISSHQLASDLGITQKSAWFMLHRIRQAFGQKVDSLSNTVEVDETFVGGKSKNKHAIKKTRNERGGTISTQQPVLGMKERNGQVMAVVVPNRYKETILPIVLDVVTPGSTIMTDEYTAYKDLRYSHKHFKVNHSVGQYVDNNAHTNGIENFWSHLKRGIQGIYHQVSKRHLQAYVDEFVFRYNIRDASTNDKFDYSLQNSSRLTYRQLAKNGAKRR